MTFITDEILSEGGITGTTISGGTLFGNASNLTGINFTGGTVTGATNFTGGLTANTISATTYQNLPQVSTIYTADGSLTGNRIVTMGGRTLTFTENIVVASDVLVGKGPNFNSGNIVIGKDAGININTSTDNIIVGLSSSNSLLIGNKNISIGTNSQFLNENSNNNISIGVDSLYSNVNSDSNIAIGNSSLYFNESDNNIGIGEGTLSATTTGNQNVAIGSASLSNNTTGLRNTVVGYNAGNGNTSGNSITLIGRQANVGVDGLSNATAIGANSLVDSSNSLVLGAIGTKVGISTTNPTKDLQVIGDIESTTLSATTVSSTKLGLLAISDPAAPLSGNLLIYSKDIAGRILPKWIGPSGIDTPFQSNIMFNQVSVIGPGGGTTVGVFGCTVTNVGTISNPNITTTNLKTQTRRFVNTMNNASGSLASTRIASLECWRGNVSSQGGFFVVVRFGVSVLGVGNRMFVGLTDTATAAPTNIDPTTSATPGKIGMAINTNTGNWNLVHNINGTAPTVIPLGASYPVNITDLLELILFAKPNDTVVTYRISNLSTGAQTSGTLSTNLPATTTPLGRVIWMTNNATAGTLAFDCSRFSLETDY